MEKEVKKVFCEKCGLYISAQNYSRHINRCDGTGLREYKKLQKPESLNCQYCDKLSKNLNSLRQHEVRCSKNPNRRDYHKVTTYVLENVKGKNKLNCESIFKQQQTMTQKYIDGYVSPIKGRKISFDYIYEEHNQKEINKWLEFISNINVDNNYTLTEHTQQGYNLISAESLKQLEMDIVQEHRYVANILLNNNLKKENIVHHINRIRTDNRKENLIVFIDSQNHKRFHNSKYAKIFYDESTHLFSCILDIENK